MSETPCPGLPRLRLWLDGDQDLDGFEAIGAHVNHCADCQARLDRLIGDDQLGRQSEPELAAAGYGAWSALDARGGDGNRPDTSFGSHTHPTPRPGLDEPPPELPRYEQIELLDGGGMGIVYKAHDTKLNRTVAVKVMRRKMAADPDNRARFRREAEAMARLDHERVVRVYDVGEYDGGERERVPYFAMEYVGGGTLAQRIGRRPLPPRDAAALAAQVAYGLDHAHLGGVVHRDLKPANILLTEGGRAAPGGSTRDELRGSTGGPGQAAAHAAEASLPAAKITDFGLARQLDAGAGATIPGTILGTPSYMAPEQARGECDLVGPRSDVYSLGAVLYEMLTGRPPFEAPTAEQTRRLVAGDQDPPPVRALQPGVARDLETICMKCLEKDPARRYATAAGVGRDLDNWFAGRPIVARPAGPVERLTKVVRRNPAEAGLVLLLVLTVIGGFGAVLWQLGRVKDREAQVRVYAGRVEQEKEVAVRNEREAVANRDRSNAYFRMASDAVHQFLLTELGQEQFEIGLVPGRVRPRPQQDPTRRVLLQKAETIYEQLLALESDPATGSGVDSAAWNQAQRTLATVLDNLAIYLEGGGDPKGADERRVRALRLREQLVAARPGVPEFRHGLALSHLNLGIWHRKQGKGGHTRAEELMKGTLATADALRAEYPGVPDYLHLKARGHANLAVLYDATGRRDDATREFRTAAACLEELVGLAPDLFRYRHDRAAVLGELAGHTARPDREAALWSALAAWEQLACEHPEEPDALDELTTRYYVLGAWYRDAGRAAEQEEAWRTSALLSEGLVRAHPGVFGYAANLATVSYNLGVLAVQQGDYNAAVPRFGRAIGILDGAPITTHADPTWFFRRALLYRGFALSELGRYDESLADLDRLLRIAPADERGDVRITRGEVLARKGNHVAAVTEAEGAVAGGVPAESLIDAARVFALASGAAGRDAASSPGTRAAAELYAARAVRLLNEAADAGVVRKPVVAQVIRDDPAFAALEERADFRGLLARMPK